MQKLQSQLRSFRNENFKKYKKNIRNKEISFESKTEVKQNKKISSTPACQ